MNARKKILSYIRSCLLYVVFPTLLVLLLITFTMWLGVFHDSDPQGYEEYLSRTLGIYGECSASYFLSAEDAGEAGAAGLNPDAVANALAASQWCVSNFGGEIDIGIMLAIHQYESGNATNMGSCDAISVIRGLGYPFDPAREERQARRLLDWWRSHNVRERNPIAAYYIYPDYSGWTGGCSTGEMGGAQFIATTGWQVCQNGLARSGDQELASCDFWSLKTEFHAIAYWLDAIGYRATLTDSEKVNELAGWNVDREYRERLVARANEINGDAGGIADTLVSFDGEEVVFGQTIDGSLKWIAIEYLKLWGLLPDFAQGWLTMPLRPEDFRYITQEYDPVTHPGIDYSCYVGVPIIAVGDGRVVGVIHQDFGFGNHVWVYHPNGLYTVYAHMSQTWVAEGQIVRRGQTLGECGSTGNSTGPHVHFSVYEKGPDVYNYIADALNPHFYLGKCASRRGD